MYLHITWLVLIAIILSPTVAVKASNGTNKICTTTLLYEVCGSRELFEEYRQQYQLDFNFDRRDQEELADNLFELLNLSNIDKLPLDIISRNKSIEQQWNAQIQLIVPTLKFIGYYPEINQFSGKYTLTGPYYMPKSAQDTFRHIVLSPSNLNLDLLLLYSDKPIYQVYLHASKDPIIEHTIHLKQMCSLMNFYGGDFKSTKDCENVIRHQLHSSYKLPPYIRSQVGMDVEKDLIHYYRLAWLYATWYEGYKKYIINNPRKVYMVKAPANTSPRVDMMGNVYLPEKFYEDFVLTDTRQISQRLGMSDCASKRSFLDLVLLHEINHIKVYSSELNKSPATLFIKEIVEKYTGRDPMKDTETKRRVINLIQFWRHPDEAYIDLLTLSDLKSNRCDRERYAKMVSNFEFLGVHRLKMLEVVTGYANAGYSPDRMIGSCPVILTNLMIGRFEKSIVFKSDEERSFLKTYFSQYQDYYMKTIIKMGVKEGDFQRPWETEKMLDEAFDSIFQKIKHWLNQIDQRSYNDNH